jgi:hypothetical protein
LQAHGGLPDSVVCSVSFGGAIPAGKPAVKIATLSFWLMGNRKYPFDDLGPAQIVISRITRSLTCRVISDAEVIVIAKDFGDLLGRADQRRGVRGQVARQVPQPPAAQQCVTATVPLHLPALQQSPPLANEQAWSVRGRTREKEMNLSMKDRVAVVTGGSKGIGIAVARRFAESGPGSRSSRAARRI